MRARPFTAVVSIALGGCVIVLPSCPGQMSSPSDATTPIATTPTPLPSERTPSSPPPEPTAPPPEPTVQPAAAPLTRYALTVLDDRPAAYWRFEEQMGFVAMDASGQNRHGSYLDRPVLGDSVGAPNTGDAVSLQNQTDGVLVGYAVWTNMTSLTVEAWVRPRRVTSPEGMIVVDKGNTWNLYIDPEGKPAFQFPGNSPPETRSSTPLIPGETYHLVGTFESGAMMLYVNGVAVSYGTTSASTIANNAEPIHVGRGLGAMRWEFQGVIDDVALYDKALSPDAILRHYRTGR